MDSDIIEENETAEEESSDSRQVIRTNSSGQRSRVSYNTSSASSEDTPEELIPNDVFFLYICIALLCDLISVILDFVPVLGDFIEDVLITPLFIFLFKRRGVNYMKASRLVTTVLAPIVKLIPVVNIIPTWTLEVVIITLSVRAEQKIKG